MTIDLEKLVAAWAVAKKALEKSDEELRAVKAGHEVAVLCERDAWQALERLRPKAAETNPHPPVEEEKMAQALRAAQQKPQYAVTSGWGGVMGTSPNYHYSYSGTMGSGGMGSATGGRW